MSYAEERPALRSGVNEHSTALAHEWRRLGRAATAVALLTSPAFFLWCYDRNGWNIAVSLLVTAVAVVAFRGLVDVIAHKLIPSPSLYGSESELAEQDIVDRRRVWYWRKKWRLALWIVVPIGTVLLVMNLAFGITLADIGKAFVQILPLFLTLLIQLPLLFFINFLILFGPIVFLGIQQIKGYEPGDADWGVKLSDVRGQEEAKKEITRVVSLWQSGEAFEKAGGKRERGVLFLGAPGTGKTMLSKAIATSFNCPFVTIPGSGFAQTFIGMDAVIVRYLARKAKKLASKWGGQCIVFIDEIDAVGMRRQSLGQGGAGMSSPGSIHDHLFFGPQGAITPDGELMLKSRAWQERVFAAREEPRPSPYPPVVHRVGAAINQFVVPGGMGGGGGGLALNQLLVVMDGIDDPPMMKRFFTNRINTLLDAVYVVPRRIGSRSLRLKPPRPRKEDIYFIGACNVPLEMLDPALTRPGRMGRHVWFRTPIKKDREDIFDLYLAKVDHEPDLDTPQRRDELARMTQGYSPAMIEQVCSMALTYAHSEGRPIFGRGDLVEAMTTVESGTAVAVDYVPEETRATAIHEAGHAVCSHVYMEDTMSTRLSIRMRGNSLGHHQAIEKEERFSSWRHEDVGHLVWTVGAMAAEHVFYGENSRGVAGDMRSATTLAALMVGQWAMGAEQVDFADRFSSEEKADEAAADAMKRFERIGQRLMNRTSQSTAMQSDVVSAVLQDPSKRAAAAQLLGQAYLSAYNLVAYNRDKVEFVANALVERKEMHGDEVVELLDQVDLVRPQVDLLDRRSWPKV
ncbi:MAG: AAA family ATPase [Solirubrobacteraceae bacterium]